MLGGRSSLCLPESGTGHFAQETAPSSVLAAPFHLGQTFPGEKYWQGRHLASTALATEQTWWDPWSKQPPHAPRAGGRHKILQHYGDTGSPSSDPTLSAHMSEQLGTEPSH